MKDVSRHSIKTDDPFSSLLELAANNDADSFKQFIESDSSAIDSVGLWLVRKKGAKQVVEVERTPLMVASTYGSIDVLKLILSLPEVDVNRTCGPDKCTALHCATSGGSVNVIEVVKLLISAGADPNIEDFNGQRAADVISVPPKLPGGRAALEDLLLNNTTSDGSVGGSDTVGSNASSPVLSSSPENGSPCYHPRESKREYPIDPSLPDIKNGVYSSDEFRMFSFKVRPCSRAYSHDWTECPFVHPGENARRRDPRKYHYSCVPCPEFRKGACRRGDMCEYAHGVFECWLHPAQYRTRLCKDGTSCARRVCFFAHTAEELRPLYVSTGSAVPSPRSSAATATVMDMAVALSLLPGSPTANSIPHSSPPTWTPHHQPSVPTLHLPGSNLQSSRLRTSFNARENMKMMQEYDSQLGCFSPSLTHPNSLLTPSNLEELFSAENNLSPRYSDQMVVSSGGVFSPSHKFNQFQQQQRMLSPINTTTTAFSPGRMSTRSVDPISPMSGRHSTFAQTEKQQQLRSVSSRDLGGSPVVGKSWSNLGPALNTNIDWSLNGHQLGSSEESNVKGPDLSWVQSLVKEYEPSEIKGNLVSAPVLGGAGPSGSQNDGPDSIDYSALGAWLEQMQIDQQLVA
ncbi:unnamed protein product [Cuscuta epithymum]|uniref:C3H1-type domain-containing protein n=1 Tax=Cuscuta epithymum TaxID=186058 RepID=A0AAV0CXU1_9ASTE|nr:unnamed protein product [Cuscuta epithymum]